MKRPAGFLHWLFPAMLGLVALASLLSGRDLSDNVADLEAGAEAALPPLVAWGQRIVSLLLLLASAERLATHLAWRQPIPSPLLLWTFLAYWVATVAAPALFGAHPEFSHNFLYALVIGTAVVLANTVERDHVLKLSRNTLFLFMLGGVALVPLNASLVLDSSYTQGLLPGVPRFGGLAPHPVSMGMLAQTALLVLWAYPFARRWLNRLAWLLGLGVLFCAQSKTAWIAFVLCSITMLIVRSGGGLGRRLSDPRQQLSAVLLCLGFMVAVLGVMVALLLTDLSSQVSGFFDTPEGAQLASMTGRDRIWIVAWEEWRASPIFGYGPSLWDWEFRSSIGMHNATHAHNQFLDTLARSGGLGAAALVVYAVVLLVLAVRHARETGGLSLALFVALALRSISEVPLLLFGYGTELFSHLLLLITLASAATVRQRPAVQPRPRPMWEAQP